ncbi:MAG: DUF5947 family protein [Actinomycetes bacterium]
MTSSAAPSRNPLRRVLDAPPTAPAEERCELCAVPIGPDHGHLVDLHNRSLMCGCRPCTLLFTRAGAGGGRYRAVPDRVLRDPDLAVADRAWDALQIPVGMAFFFRNSALGQVVAFYPSPAGATESELPLSEWEGGLGASRLAALMEDDVEALLVRHRPGGAGECYLAPIDVCYELVGRVRTHWRGFDGGTEAWAAIDDLFARLAERSRLA